MLYLQLDFLTHDEFSLSLSLKVIFCSCAGNWISWNCNWSVLRNIFQITPINFSSSIFFFFFKTPHLMSLIIFFHPFAFVMKFDFHDISTETQMNEWKKFWNEIAATCYELIRTSTSWLPLTNIIFIQHSTSEKSKMRRKLPDGYQKGKKCERGGGGDEKWSGWKSI